MGRTGGANHHDGQAVVLLVDCAGGRELQVVRDALAGAWDTPTVLIRRTDLGSATMSFDPGTGLLDVDGRRVRPVVVWVRHSSASALAARAMPPLDAASWSGFFERVAASATAALPGTSPVGAGQLVDAGRLGVRVPRTVVTTDVAAGAQRMETPRVIVKTPDFRVLEPDPRAWPACAPEVVDRDAVRDRPARGRPVVVQEYVVHARELRVYHLDGGISAFDVGKPDPASLWTDPDGVTVTRVECPDVAEKAVRTLCTEWNLRYGAFDLLVSPAGEVVFLEANPDGDWLWFERKAGWHGVSFMAAVMMRELFVRGTSLGVPTA